MAKSVIVIYDDTRKPNSKIKSITGGNSFGNTIFKRQTLRNHMKSFFEQFENVKCLVDSRDYKTIKDKNTPVIYYYSDYIVSDAEGMKTLITKALYAHDIYNVYANNKVACVIYPNINEVGHDISDAKMQIDVNCLTDISDVMNFRQFITSGFEARFFNSVSGDEYTVVKTSENMEKLRAEYEFYALLPDNMKQWFVMPYNYATDGAKASYQMQRYHMTDLAIRYVHGAIGLDEFSNLLDRVFYFLKTREQKQVGHDEYEECAKNLYIDKVAKRIEMLKANAEYSKLSTLIQQGTDYESIDDIYNHYVGLYDKVRASKKFMDVKVISHGDLCFSNMLYDDDTSLLKLIDPKGAIKEEDMYMDPYYDMAKLSHSICGHYDFYNSEKYELTFDEDLKMHVYVEADNRDYVDIFKSKLSESGVDFRLIRVYEASLFLSMLPLHMDRPKKVLAFILNAIAIMKSLEE